MNLLSFSHLSFKGRIRALEGVFALSEAFWFSPIPIEISATELMTCYFIFSDYDLQCILRFVTFSFPKKVLTNRVLLTNRGVTDRRMHSITYKTIIAKKANLWPIELFHAGWPKFRLQG